jgi:hypothetical protein
VALGFLIGFASFDLGLTTVSSCYLAGDSARPSLADLAHVDQIFPFLLAEVECGDARGILDEADDWNFPFITVLIISQASVRSDR